MSHRTSQSDPKQEEQFLDEMRRIAADYKQLKQGTINKKQRGIIFLGILIIVLMLLVPPWKFYGGRDAGYGLLFYPYPTIRAPLVPAEGIKVRPIYKETASDVALYIDVRRLLIQCLIVAALTSGVAFLLQSQLKPPTAIPAPIRKQAHRPFPSLDEIHELEDEELEQAQREIRKLKTTRLAYRASLALLVVLLLYETLRYMRYM